MKVAMVANSCWNLFNYRRELIQAIHSEFGEVVLIAPEDRYASMLAKEKGIHYIPVLHLDKTSSNLIKELRFVIELFRIYYREKPDLIMHYTIKPNVFGSMIAHVLGIPSIATVTGLGSSFTKHNKLSLLICWLYRLAFRYNKINIFQNHTDRNFFLQKKLVNEINSGVILGSGVDCNYFVPRAKSESNKFIFLFIGRLIRSKGIVEYLKAASLIKSKWPDIECQVVGSYDSTHPDRISKTELDEALNQNDIRWFDHVDDVRDLIAAADVVVLPSYREGMPRSILESMAMGKPIITTDVAGCNETVINGINGYLIPAQNVDSLVNAMNDMYSLLPEKRLQMGNESRTRALDQFAVQHIITKYLNIISEFK